MSLCLAGGGMVVQVLATAFTLAWTHTVQKSEWQEDWRILDGRLVIEEGRIQGSGAGMEPPDGARLENGFYVWRPDVLPIAELVLRRAPEAGDWRLCAGGKCEELGEWLGVETDPVTLLPCPDPADIMRNNP